MRILRGKVKRMQILRILGVLLAAAAATAAAYWLFLALSCLFIDKSREYERPSKFYYALLNSGYTFLYKAARARVHTSGLDKIPTDRRFLIVSNHLSNFDNMIQSPLMKGVEVAYISKPENFRIPIGGRFIKRSCYMAIERGNLRSSLVTIKHAAALMRDDIVNVGVYPEGRRGKSYDLQPFHPGCLDAAIWAKAPVVVATITGTENIHKNFPFRHTDVHFDVIAVIETQGRRSAELSEEIRHIMQTHLDTYKTERTAQA